MPIITLTSDFGLKDYYIGSVKGAILSLVPDATIVDISHSIQKFDLVQTAFVLKNAYVSFPAGTVHIIGVKTEGTLDSPHMAVKHKGHYFVGADSGIFSLLFDEQPEEIVIIKPEKQEGEGNFPLKDVLAKAACFLAKGGKIQKLGFAVDEIRQLTKFRPIIESGMLRGSVIYVDSFGNCITNISKAAFEEAAHKRGFTIYLRNEEYNITELSSGYADSQPGDAIALIGSSRNIEVAINSGNASELLGIKTGDIIRIEFDGH